MSNNEHRTENGLGHNSPPRPIAIRFYVSGLPQSGHNAQALPGEHRRLYFSQLSCPTVIYELASLLARIQTESRRRLLLWSRLTNAIQSLAAQACISTGSRYQAQRTIFVLEDLGKTDWLPMLNIPGSKIPTVLILRG